MTEVAVETLPMKYREFFVESPAGIALMKELENMVALAHEQAEDDPELARDYTQRAKGVRDVIWKIKGLTMEVNRGNTAR